LPRYRSSGDEGLIISALARVRDVMLDCGSQSSIVLAT
jgi:hypothetical protein